MNVVEVFHFKKSIYKEIIIDRTVILDCRDTYSRGDCFSQIYSEEGGQL